MSTHNSWRLPDNSADPSSTPLLREVINRDKSLTDAYIPDLSASKLSIVLVDMSPSFIKDPAILVGYAGTRGCKVTLVATSKELEGSGEFRFLAQGENSAYAWRSGNLEYLLIAKGMDSERFDLIAESVYRATIERLPFDDSTRTALLDSRRKSVPCMA